MTNFFHFFIPPLHKTFEFDHLSIYLFGRHDVPANGQLNIKSWEICLFSISPKIVHGK
jgi:hypothetical protein